LLRKRGSTAQGCKDIKHVGEASLLKKMRCFDQGDIKLELFISGPSETPFRLPEMVEERE
jgi:hypothetical protein